LGVVNQIKGDVPELRFLLPGMTAYNSSASCPVTAACFLSRVLKVVSLRISPSSSSESDESEPERLSSRSKEFQQTFPGKTGMLTSYKPFEIGLRNSWQAS